MRELLVIEHTAAAGVSTFAEVLDANRPMVSWRVVDAPAGEPLPTDVSGLAGLLVMGGTMSAVDPSEHPWMGPELELLRAATAADVPVFGICLGAQLLAQAHGGEVRRRAVPEVGYLPLVRTDAGRRDEVMRGWTDGDATFFLHEDEVTTLPEEAIELLTGSDGVPAWQLGSALAVQFHPEVNAEQLRPWLDRGLLGELLDRAAVDGEALLEEAVRRSPTVVPQGQALLSRWLDGPVRRRVHQLVGDAG